MRRAAVEVSTDGQDSSGRFCSLEVWIGEDEFVSHGAFNLGGLAGYLGQPVVHDDESGTWVFGESAGDRTAALRSLQAPDFTLPDLDGRMHSLSDYRGRKVFLVSWASW